MPSTGRKTLPGATGAARRRPPSSKATYEAVLAAGGDRRLAQAAIEAQPFPYITDVLDGFAIHLVPVHPDEVRRIRVTLRETGMHVRLYDTAAAGTTMLDDAVVEELGTDDWGEAVGLMARAGVALTATVGRKPAVLGRNGRLLTVAPSDLICAVDEPVAAIGFAWRRSWLVSAQLRPSGRCISGLDWVLVQHRLRAEGIAVEACLVRGSG